MSLSKSLLKQAGVLRAQSPEYTAVQMLKQAGMDETTARTEVAQKLMEKEATSALVATGIDYDQALQLVKVAGVKIQDLTEFKPEASAEEDLAEFLCKSASEVEALEAKASQVDTLLEKVAELEQLLADTPVYQEVSEPVTKMAQSGNFTNEDLQALMSLPSETLSKVASVSEKPWSMGKSAGLSTESLDPLASWILS